MSDKSYKTELVCIFRKRISSSDGEKTDFDAMAPSVVVTTCRAMENVR